MNIAPNSVTKNTIDALYDQAVAFVIKCKDTSCSGLQRHLHIGYSLALALSKRMEKNGIFAGIETRSYRAELERVTIKVIDIGVAGCNLMQEIIGKDISGIEIISVKAGVPTFRRSSRHKVIPTGEVNRNIRIKPEDKHQLPLNSRLPIEEALSGAHIVFVVAGMSDDTRYGDASIIAQIAGKQGALSIVVVYRPSSFDHTQCQKVADEELRAMKSPADALFVISNTRQGELDDHATVTSPFVADTTSGEIASKWIRCMASFMIKPSLLHVGLNDFCHAMTGSHKNGCAIIKPAGGQAQGLDRAVHATAKALAHPSFREHLSQADGILYIITTANSKNLTGCELSQISEEIQKHISERCFCLCNVRYEPDMPLDGLKVEILASHWAE